MWCFRVYFYACPLDSRFLFGKRNDLAGHKCCETELRREPEVRPSNMKRKEKREVKRDGKKRPCITQWTTDHAPLHGTHAGRTCRSRGVPWFEQKGSLSFLHPSCSSPNQQSDDYSFSVSKVLSSKKGNPQFSKRLPGGHSLHFIAHYLLGPCPSGHPVLQKLDITETLSNKSSAETEPAPESVKI